MFVLPHLSLYFLGTFQAQLNDEPLQGFRSDKVRALLGYLFMEAEQPHERDLLAGLLWPEWPNTDARNNLRTALSNLRSVLQDSKSEKPFLLSNRQIIQVNPENDYYLDARELEQHFKTIADTKSTEMGSLKLQDLRKTAELYRGPFLTGFFLADCPAFEEWILVTRERLQSQMLTILHTLATHLEMQGYYREATVYAKQRIDIDPLQEEAYRHLIQLLALNGERSAALLQFETCRQRLKEELGVEPGPETVELHHKIQTGQLMHRVKPLVEQPTQISPPSKPAPRHNLPAQTTRFIGRTTEIDAVRKMLLDPEIRLLTLTGPGGIGKTRLALQVASDLVEHFADGVFFVSLVALREPGLVDSSIAETLGVSEAGGKTLLEHLVDHVRDKQLLLVLDNFEHVIQAAPLVTDLLTAAPKLNVMITSRSLLRLYGEHNYTVPPLTFPDAHIASTFEELLGYEACQLFINRARAIKPEFSMSNGHSMAVAEICERLDGLPLAIELAAARIRLLSPQSMLAQLSSRLRFLSRGARDFPRRHQTLRNTIEWSHELLETDEQIMFRRLAIFAGSCTLDAAEVVGDATGALDTFSLLESLVDKSLLQQFDLPTGPRFEMLETIREYGLDRLKESGEETFIQQTHANYYLRLAEALAGLDSENDQEVWLVQIEIEHDNLQAVLSWARDNGEAEIGLKLAGTLWRFWERQGYISEGRQRLEEALKGSDEVDLSLLAEARTGAGTMAWHQNDLEQALVHHETALKQYEALQDKKGMAFALNNIGVQLIELGNYERATVTLEEGLKLARMADEKRTLAYILHNLGEIAKLHHSDYEETAVLFQETLILFRELGDKWTTAIELVWLGIVRCYLQDYEQAAAHFEESLLLSHTLNDSLVYAVWLEGYGALAAAQGRLEQAARLWGSAETLRLEIGVPIPPGDRVELEPYMSLVSDGLGEDAFASEWATGRMMTPTEIIADLER